MTDLIIGFTLSILLLLSSTVEISDFLFDSSALFLSASAGDLPDDSTKLFTEDDGELPFGAFDETFASAQGGDCTSNGDMDNIFFSSGTARLRPRGVDACLEPLPPVPNIYDSNEMLNQFTPETLPKPHITIPGTETEKGKEDISRLNELFNLPDYTHDTNPAEQDDVCPEDLVHDLQIPVCDSGRAGRDNLRLRGEGTYTLYNVRNCMSPRVVTVNSLCLGIHSSTD